MKNYERYRGRSRDEWDEEAEEFEQREYNQPGRNEGRSRSGPYFNSPYGEYDPTQEGRQYRNQGRYNRDQMDDRQFRGQSRSQARPEWRGYYESDYEGQSNYGRRGRRNRWENPEQRSSDGFEDYTGRGPKGWQRSDERLQEDVNEALARHRDLDPSDVEVRVENGDVTLEGTVPNRFMKRHMEDVVYSVFGVNDVQNRVRIQQDEKANTEMNV